MNAVIIAGWQLAVDTHAVIESGETSSWSTRFQMATNIGVAVLLLLRLAMVGDSAGDFAVGLVLIGAFNPQNFYYSMLRTLALFVLVIIDTSVGMMPAALVIYYASIAFIASMHTQMHLRAKDAEEDE